MVTMGRWFQQRSTLEKVLLMLSSFMILLALILVIVIAVSHDGSDGPGGSGSTCWTKGCIKSAGQMLSKISEESNPCSSFYDYACGAYSNMSGQIGSVARSSVDSVYLLIKHILEYSSSTEVAGMNSMRALYKSCMEFGGLQDYGKKPDDTLKLLMDKIGIGTWPVIDPYFDDSLLTVEERLVGLLMIGVPIVYKVDVIPDSRVNGSFIMKLSPGGPHAAGRMEKDVRGDAQLRTHLLSSFLLLGAPYVRASADVDDILSVDNQLAEIQQSASTDCDSTDTFAPEEALDRLKDMIPETDWSSLIKAIQKAAGLSSKPFAVQVYCKEKIKEYLEYLVDLSTRSAYNYLGWRFFTAFDTHIMPNLRRPQSMNGAGGQARWKDCIKLIEQYAAPSLAEALTAHEIQNATVVKVKELTHNLKSSMESLLSNTRWLDKEEKTTTKQQLKSIDIRPPFVQKHIKHDYSFLRFSEMNSDNYTTAVIELRRQQIAQMLKNLNPAEENSLFKRKLILTSDFIPSQTSHASITFDKIQEPFFSVNGPDSINFGGLGTFAARELSKALILQNVGVSVEDETTLWDIWFRDASGCFLNSLASRFGLDDGNELMKRKWIKELFLDTSSLEIAYQSSKTSNVYQKLPGLSRTSEQLFFMAYAQTFCAAANSEENYLYIPIRDRVNAVLSNSKHFNKVFSCHASSTCDIWS